MTAIIVIAEGEVKRELRFANRFEQVHHGGVIPRLAAVISAIAVDQYGEGLFFEIDQFASDGDQIVGHVDFAGNFCAIGGDVNIGQQGPSLRGGASLGGG